jgi:hypothetical protein
MAPCIMLLKSKIKYLKNKCVYKSLIFNGILEGLHIFMRKKKTPLHNSIIQLFFFSLELNCFKQLVNDDYMNILLKQPIMLCHINLSN